MKRSKRSGRQLAKNALRSEIEELRHVYRSKRVQFRTQYELVIRNLEQVFSADQIHYGIYEEMFSSIELQRLSAFLQVQYYNNYAHKRFNVSPKTREIDPTLETEIKDFYAATYAFCFEKFPQTRKLWKSY